MGDFWTVPATPDRVVDGDTIDLTLDLGYHVTYDTRIRLLDVDTAETYGVAHASDEYARGLVHKRYTEDWIVQAVEMADDPEWPVRVTTLKQTGKYGRWIGMVHRDDGHELTADLKSEFGDAVADD